MASKGIPTVLEVEEPPSTGQARGIRRGHRADPQDESGQSQLGCTEDPWRTAETGIRAIASYGRQIHGAASEAAFSDMAHVPRQPHKGFGGYRLFCSTDSFISGLVCLRDPVARPPAACALRGDRTSHGR